MRAEEEGEPPNPPGAPPMPNARTEPAQSAAPRNSPWTEAYGIEKDDQGLPHPLSETLRNLPWQENPYHMPPAHRWETCTDDAKALAAYFIHQVLKNPKFGDDEIKYGPRFIWTDAESLEFAGMVPNKASVQEQGINAEYLWTMGHVNAAKIDMQRGSCAMVRSNFNWNHADNELLLGWAARQTYEKSNGYRSSAKENSRGN